MIALEVERARVSEAVQRTMKAIEEYRATSAVAADSGGVERLAVFDDLLAAAQWFERSSAELEDAARALARCASELRVQAAASVQVEERLARQRGYCR
jgi:phage terminase Nu1 subunit (DNA packaging protein)